MGEEVLARWSDEGWYYRGNKNFGCILWQCAHIFVCACVFVGAESLVCKEIFTLKTKFE